MPLHDYECGNCGLEFEQIAKWNERLVFCPKCEFLSKRVYKGFRGMKHDSPNWLVDTLEVVDKDGGRHCQEFLKSPTRSNYVNWMKGEGIRPMEPGEERERRRKPDTTPIRNKVKENFKKRNAIEVKGGYA